MFFPKIPTRTVFSPWFRRPENHLVPYNICMDHEERGGKKRLGNVLLSGSVLLRACSGRNRRAAMLTAAIAIRSSFLDSGSFASRREIQTGAVAQMVPR